MTTAYHSAAPSGPHEPQSLEKTVSHLLEECRMVLPGIQAIFGFQLIAVFNNGFSEKLSQHERCAHLASVGLIVLAIACLLAPAAYHRIAETRSISNTFVSLASWLLSFGLFFLMLGICVDFFLIARIILQTVIPAAVVTGSAVVLLGGMWFIFPLYRRFQNRIDSPPRG